MSVVSPRAPPAVINWHLSRTESLPMYFGFNEKKPIPWEHLSIHRSSLQRLDHEFFILRNPDLIRITDHSPTTHTHPLEELRIPSVVPVDDVQAIHGIQDNSISISEAQHVEAEQKYGEEKPAEDLLLTPELTVGGGPGAVSDPHASHKPLVEEAPTGKSEEAELFSPEKEAAISNVGVAAEPIAVAAVVAEIPVASTEVERSKEDARLLTAQSKKEEEEVPMRVPVAEPVDAALKRELHGELEDKERRLEEERVAAIGIAQGGGSLVPLETALVDQAGYVEEVHERQTQEIPVPLAEPVEPTAAASTTGLHAPHPSLELSGATTLEQLRSEEEEEAAAMQAQTAELETDSEMTAAEREKAELALMSRTQRLAALHESIIAQEKLAAQPTDPATVKRSPALLPTAPSSRIAEIQQLHLAQQAASGETHTAVEKAAPSAAPVRGGRIAEMKRLHEQKIKDEADAKKKQDELFAGRYLQSGGKKTTAATASPAKTTSSSSSTATSPKGSASSAKTATSPKASTSTSPKNVTSPVTSPKTTTSPKGKKAAAARK